MAHVYLARDLKHDRDVAVKIIKSDLSASLGHDRFLREIEIAARLRHPNIVPLYDSGEAEGSLFFVMPYEDGQSLRERLRDNGALPIADALSVLRDVARALAYAHKHGVVHRDIKPDNVMLSGDAAVVTDFGIAKAVSVAFTGPSDATLTQAGTVIGTPAYMAPEQATGDASIDHRADIYSFGCFGYELFTGQPPFQEQTTHLLIAAHLATQPRPITEVRPDVPLLVAELLARCLAKAPTDRPQSARELLLVLDGATLTAPHRRAGRSSLARKSAVAALVGAIVVTAGYVGIRSAWTTDPITVAVLPFSNIAGDTAIGFVADGLTDEVASALARVPGVTIKSRAGARAYRGQLAPDVTEAGAKLKADYLLTGVARQENGQWILTADFERAADATSLWDDRFVVSPNEQAAAVDSITARLIVALRREFPRAIGTPRARSPRQRTVNNEAYRLYLRGQEKLNRRGQSVTEAGELFRQSIRQDSLFAPAHAGLAYALAISPWFDRVPVTQVKGEAIDAAGRALALDSTLSLPHVALGVAHVEAYEWAPAAIEFKTAVDLDANNVEARIQYARMLSSVGRYSEALAQLRVARNQDPASALLLGHMARVYFHMGQMDSALAEIGRALETDSSNYMAIAAGPWIYLKLNRLAEAHALAVRSRDPGYRAYHLARSGDVEGARGVLRGLDGRPAQWGDEMIRALAYLGLGDTASGLSALERAANAKELWPVKDDHVFDSVRSSARFRALEKRVGLADFISSSVP